MTTYESVTGGPQQVDGRLPLAFAVGIVVSLVTRDVEAEERFIEAERRIVIGATSKAVPAEAAVAHRRPTG